MPDIAPPALTLDEIHRRRGTHERELDINDRYFTVSQLADRWKVSRATVRAIPADELPYTAAGRGAILKRRRYDPHDVLRFENRRRGSPVEA